MPLGVPKLDIVLAPRMMLGGMENYGLIFLNDSDTKSQGRAACGVGRDERAGGPSRASTNGSSMPQHSAACHSTRFWELLVGVLKHAAACRSEPKLSHGGLFFFITCQTCGPFVAQISQNWMVAQWSM